MSSQNVPLFHLSWRILPFVRCVVFDQLSEVSIRERGGNHRHVWLVAIRGDVKLARRGASQLGREGLSIFRRPRAEMPSDRECCGIVGKKCRPQKRPEGTTVLIAWASGPGA